MTRETPPELVGIDDELEGPPAQGKGLGPLGQLLATLAIAAIVGLLIVGALGVLSWLFG